MVQDKAFQVLIDSSSTHNFIVEETASRLGLTPTASQGISVAVANGDQVSSTGVCAAVPIRIGDEDFQLDCYVIPLAGFDVVLGVQWLDTLRPIL